MNKSIRRFLAAAAATVVLGLTSFGGAHAAVYQGSWDPPYGSPFATLSWRGDITVFVPQSCVLFSGLRDNATDCSGTATMQMATVELNDTAVAPFYNTLTFNPASMSIQTLLFSGGLLAGLETTMSNWVNDSVLEGVDFALQLTLDGTVHEEGSDGPKLFWRDDVHNGMNNPDQTPTLTFRAGQAPPMPVPEPDSSPLVLGALAVSGWLGRRRTSAAAA